MQQKQICRLVIYRRIFRSCAATSAALEPSQCILAFQERSSFASLNCTLSYCNPQVYRRLFPLSPSLSCLALFEEIPRSASDSWTNEPNRLTQYALSKTNYLFCTQIQVNINSKYQNEAGPVGFEPTTSGFGGLRSNFNALIHARLRAH